MNKRGLLVITLSILLALIMYTTPMPLNVDKFRPVWILLVIVYWTLALPHRINVGSAFFIGLLVDILQGTVLGTNSLALSIITYIVGANYQRFRNYSVWQQATIVALLTALYQLIVFWVQHILNDVVFLPQYLWPMATTALIWPWAFLLMRKVRRQFKVS